MTTDNERLALSVSDNMLTLTSASGQIRTVELPDNDTTYSLDVESISGISEDGNPFTQKVLRLRDDGQDVVNEIPLPVIYYRIEINDGELELIGSDGVTDSVDLSLLDLDDAQIENIQDIVYAMLDENEGLTYNDDTGELTLPDTITTSTRAPTSSDSDYNNGTLWVEI